MDEINTIFDGLEHVQIIKDELVFLDNLHDIEAMSTTQTIKMDYNAIIHCRRGKVLLEVGGNKQVQLEAGQLMLLPAHKLLQPMMVSTDIDAVALLMSNRVLKATLGAQIDIWNRAMYVSETYVINGERWTHMLQDNSNNVFRNKELLLRKEFVSVLLRLVLLVICEELLRIQKQTPDEYESNDRDKILFNRFLELLSHEPQKRQQVHYYAQKLHITAKYLSSICRKTSGKTPIHWITESVMEECYELLRNTDLSVKEISNRMGFPNSSFFGQFFRGQAGMTPLDYRRKGRLLKVPSDESVPLSRAGS